MHEGVPIPPVQVVRQRIVQTDLAINEFSFSFSKPVPYPAHCPEQMHIHSALAQTCGLGNFRNVHVFHKPEKKNRTLFR